MKSAFSFLPLILPSMALATFTFPLLNSSTTLVGLDTTANITSPLDHRQVGPKVSGSPCSDEGAWLCMSSNFQRCASGEWSTVQKCASGTQCEPLGLTHNASQPAFGIYDGSGIVTTDASLTTTFSAVPVTKTTTTDVIVTVDGSASSPTVTSSAKSTSTRTGTSTTSSSSSSTTPGAPKADTAGGARSVRLSWLTVGTMSLCLAAAFWRR